MSPELILESWALEYEKPLVTNNTSKITDLALRIAANLFTSNPAEFKENERLDALLLAQYIANENIERSSMYSVRALMHSMQIPREVVEELAKPSQIIAEQAMFMMPLLSSKIEEIKPKDPYCVEEYDVISSISLIVQHFSADEIRITEIEKALSC